MSTHYNAFISYKHAELDNRVAEDIQRSLERFPVPHAIKKKTGKKKIERIFRDKDELPITSDLTSNISEALENSDYLIVICSPNTAKSTWVKREIAYFLKNHTMNQVLTVLAGGESQDVIPDVLRHKEETITDENGEEHTITIPVEPLACDYRIPFGRAHKEEIPRLAAVLLGCSYDELVRRQRQYKMRQLGIIFSVSMALALGFGGYMLYSKEQIDKNYQEALINQSRFLANESMRLYDNKHRVESLQLALASLPSSDKDKHPVTTESITALIKSTEAYSQPELSYQFVWDYDMYNLIIDFDISANGMYLAVSDKGNKINIWNTENHMKLFDSSFNEIDGMSFIGDDKFILWEKNAIYCYSLPSGNEKWSYTISELELEFDSYSSQYGLLVPGDGTFIIPTNQAGMLYRFNIDTGKLIETIEINKNLGSHEKIFYSYITISPDGKRIAMLGSQDEENLLCVYNLLNKNAMVSRLEKKGYSLAWGDNDHLFRDCHNKFDVESDKWYQTTSVNEVHYIQCINANDLSELWSSEITTRGIKRQIGFERIPESDKIVCYIANTAYVYDINSGEQLYGGYASGAIVSTKVTSVGVLLITDTGDIVDIGPNEKSKNMFESLRTLPNDITKARIKTNMYVLRENSTSILCYGLSKGDDEWVPIDNENTYNYYKKTYNENYMAILFADQNNNTTINLYDINSCSLLDTFKLSQDDEFYGCYLLNIYNNKIYVVDKYDFELISIDIKSKAIDRQSLGESDASSCFSMANNKIAYIESNTDGDYSKKISIFNVEDNSKFSLDIDFTSGLNGQIKYLPKSNTVFYTDDKNSFIIDINSKKTKSLDFFSTYTYFPPICENNSGTQIAIGYIYKFCILDKDLNIVSTVDNPRRRVIGLTYEKIDKNKDEVLFVANQTGELLYFDTSSSLTTYLMSFSVYGNIDLSKEGVSFIFDHERNYLYLQMEDALVVIDSALWYQHVFIKNCLCYASAADRFIVSKYKNYITDSIIGYYPHYSVEDLKKKANKLLNGQGMSKEIKTQYGISE